MASDKRQVQISSEKESKHILGWVFGIFILLVALIIVFKGFISGIAMMLLGLLLLPPSRKWLESKINKKIHRVVAGIVGFVLFLVSIFSFPSQSHQTSQVAQDTSSNTNTLVNEPVLTNEGINTNQAEVVPVVTPEVKEEPKPKPSTLDKLWAALDSSIKTRNGYDVKWDEDKGVVTLTKQPDSVWDENSIVRGAYSDIVKYGQAVFGIDSIKQIQVVHLGEFTDQYGKQNNETAVEIWFDKDEFQKYDWNNLNYGPVWQQMEDSSAYYFIHPAIYKNLTKDKLYLAI